MAMSAADIIALYQKYLGRTPSDAEVEGWTSGQFGSDPAKQIPASGEGQDYAKAHPAPAAPPPPPPPTPGGPAGSNYPGDQNSPDWAHDQVAQAYKQYLGRDMSASEWNQYWKGKPVGDSIRMISTSAEARKYQTAHPAGATDPAGGGGNPYDPATVVAKWLAENNPQKHTDAAYWIKRINDTGGLNADNLDYWKGRFMEAPGTHKEGPGTGNTDLNGLASYLTDSPLLKPWTTPFNYPAWNPPPAYKPPADFVAPTGVTEVNDPGYKFRLEQGQKAIERSASAKGTLLSGGTLKDLTDYEQGAASEEFGNVYARSLQDWTTNYNKSLTDYSTTYNADMTDWTTNYNEALQKYQQDYNVFENNQAKQYNRIANLAGLGQTTAGQLAQGGLGYAQLNTNILQNGAAALGGIYTGIGNSRAAAGVAGANAYGAAFGNGLNLAAFMGMNPSSYGTGPRNA